MKKVFIGMSGGVDSSVAAALLKERGFDVVGIHLKCFNVDGCAAGDAEDARRAAEHLNIPFYVFDFEEEYKDKVVKYMVDGYKKGITPNPDVVCNQEIKFGIFYQKAMEMGADFVATGHYVRLVKRDKGQGLRVAADPNKDQSYFLWTLKLEQLAKCLFPIGEYKKPQVRKLAVKFGLHNAAKKDSQGICFLGKITLAEFLRGYIPEKRGVVLNTAGKEIGKHNGAFYYTIGQRHGLGIGGSKKPLYVSDKNVRKNILTVAEGENHPSLYKKEINLTNINFFQQITKNNPTTVYARVRYRQPVAKATLSLKVNSYKLTFAQPQKFIASGQSAVFYDAKGKVLGGGVIV